MSFLTGQSVYGQATISGLNDLYVDNIIASGNITCDTIDSTTTDDLQAQIDAIENVLNVNNGYWGQFWSTINQPNTTVNVPNFMTVNSYDASNNGIVYDTPISGQYTEIKVLNKGIYNIQFSAQLTHSNSSLDAMQIWFRKNGADIPDSNSNVSIKENGQDTVASWNIIVNAVANDKYSIMWASAMTAMTLKATAAQTTPYVSPAIPSVIITVTQIINTSQGLKGDTGDTGAQGPVGAQGAQGPVGPQGPAGPSTAAAAASAAAAGVSAAAAIAAATAAATEATAALASSMTAASAAVSAAGSASAASGSASAAAGSASAAATSATDAAASATSAANSAASVSAKTINISNAIAGMSTSFTPGSAVIADIFVAGQINSTTLGINSFTSMSLTAPVIAVGSVGVGSVSLLGIVDINGVPLIPFSPVSSFFSQF